VRLRDDQVRTRTATINQLTATLEAHWPGPRDLFTSLGSPIARAFLTDYPTPDSAARLGEARMAAFCRRHGCRGSKTPEQLLTRLRAAPVAPVGLPSTTLSAIVTAQIQLLNAVQATIAQIEKRIAGCVAAHPRARLLAALPGVGTINLAQLLAELGPILDRVESAEQAATECGAAPVTKASGKSSGVYFRHAANSRARQALTTFAHNARLQSPLGRRALCQRSPTGQTQPARGPHRRPRLAPRHLGLLAHRQPLRPGHTRRTPRPTNISNLTQGTQALPRPRDLPAAPTANSTSRGAPRPAPSSCLRTCDQ
jgi:transposase